MNRKNIVDVRGLSCPQPVIRTRQAMQEGKLLEVLVSAADQVGNVVRMAERSGWRCESREMDGYFMIFLQPGESVTEPVIAPEDLVCAVNRGGPGNPPRTVIIESEFMGRGDDRLGHILMKAFISTLKDCPDRPQKLILFNSAVKLAVVDSPVIESLRGLSSEGIEILVCGTCLDYYGLKDKLGAGIVSNMFDIAESMLGTGVVFIS